MFHSAARASTEAPAEQKPSEYQVDIRDFSFEPGRVSVPVGATVTWTNKDEDPHTVFSNDDVFKSKALDTDEMFSFKFTKAGTYKYFCSVHPKMVATIVVGSSDKKSRR
jgi:plastocyanin